MAEKRSKVWNYFSKDGNGTVTFNTCDAEISQGSDKPSQRNTSNMWYHLEKKHKALHDEAMRMTEPAAPKKRSSNTATVQQSLPQMFDKLTKWTLADPRTKKLDKLVMEMLATDIQPYNMVEGVGFKRLVAALEPRYPMKTEKFFRTKMLDEVHGQLVGRIKELLSVENAGEDIEFTTDC